MDVLAAREHAGYVRIALAADTFSAGYKGFRSTNPVLLCCTLYPSAGQAVAYHTYILAGKMFPAC